MIDLGIIGAVVAIFCRVGCCFMLLPGISSLRLAATTRLFLALGISLSLAPILMDGKIAPSKVSPDWPYLAALGRECVTGIAIGLAARIMFAAVQMAGALIMQVCGYGHPFSIDDGNGEPTSEFGALLSTCVVALLFTLDFHHVVIGAMLESYSVIGFGNGIEPALELDRLSGIVADSIRLALSIATPFVVASVLINLAFGMLNRMAPQLPVFFISAAFLMGLMLWLAWKLVPDLVRMLVAAMGAALQRI
jgi:flagellar biosynthetic protein FliR